MTLSLSSAVKLEGAEGAAVLSCRYTDVCRRKARASGVSPLNPDARARLTIRNYPGGHMMYLHRPSQEALSNDIVTFIEAGGAHPATGSRWNATLAHLSEASTYSEA